MVVLAIGDVVGKTGCNFLRDRLPKLKRLKGIDVVIANGENSADGNGITKSTIDFLFASGVDVITTGNHAFRRKESYDLYDEYEYLIRPANYPDSTTPGHGMTILDMGKTRVARLIILSASTFAERYPMRSKSSWMLEIVGRDASQMDVSLSMPRSVSSRGIER